MWHRLRSDSASSNLHSAAPVAEFCNVNRAGDQRHNIGCHEGTFEKRWFSRPEHIKGWKPLSLTTPILGAVVLLTLLIAAAVEVLAQRSQEYGGLAISPSLEAIPTYAMWSYLYGPNFVAIAYSMVWTWIDLDARRMQPWFELSKPEGATADNSLLLEYSFDFVAVVPWKSGRRKHWPVFLASTALMLVFWAVTPLQSALLATGVIDRPIELELASTSELLPLSVQQDKLHSQLRGEIYFTTWLNLTYPSFTTPEYALLPFYVEEAAQVPEKNGNLTASTSKLWTELSCSPAKTTVGENISPDGVQWDNAIPVYLSGRNGCNATIFPDLIMMRDDPRFYMDYWGSYSAENDRDLKPMDGPWRWELASPGCPDVRNQFIAAWMDQRLNSTSGGAEMKINATWCEINYYKQRVRVSVDPKSFRPLQGGISNLGPRERLSDNEFNTTAFEKFMKTGQLDNGLVNSREQFTFQHEPWLFNHSLQSLVSWYRQVKSPVGYALAVDMLDIQAYADPEVLADAYNKAWKRQFAMSVHSLMTNSSTATSQRAVIMGPMTAIIVSRSFATAVESLLLFVALVGAALLWACRASCCHLQANPSSTKRLSHITGNSPELIDLFTVMDTLDEDQLLEKLQNTRFRITEPDDGTFKEPSIEIIEDGLQSDVKGEIDETHHHYKSKKPFALHRRVGVGFLVTLVGVIIGLAYLKSQELSANGLKRPSDNLEVRQLLENYIPTVMATLTEPFWLLLNRLLCLLQPFKDLSAGKASPKRSIEATYTAIPPQLVIWRALSAKHLLLAIVCITALLANVLTLSMGALFNEEPVEAQIPQRFASSFAARIDKSVPDLVRDEGREEMSDLRQPYDIAVQANVTHNLPLPPWTTEDYYFQPVDLAELSKNDTITIRTRGFWLDTNCTFYPPTQIPLADRLPEPDNRGKDITGCSPASVEVVDAVIRGGMGSDLDPEGASKYEYVGTWPQRVPEPGAKVECDPSFSIAWGRTNEAQNNKSDVEVSKVYCQPRFQTSMFNVTVDGVGTVLSHEQTGKIEARLNDNVSRDNMRILIATLQLGALVSPRQWSSDPLPMCGFNWLLSLMRKTDSLVDPKKSLPSKEEDVLPHVEKLFRKFFVSFLAFNTALFADADEDDWVDGAIHVKEIKIFMNDPAFIITMVVLGVYALVTVLFYAKTNALVLPRMPTTIGSIIAYIAPSRLVSEGDAEKEGTAGMTYSFGRYMGHDGKPHVGIEQDPFVVPIAPGSLESRRPLLRRLGWRKKQSERADGPWM